MRRQRAATLASHLFADDNKKYLSTDLLGDEPVKPGFLAPQVALVSVRAFERVYETCCDSEERALKAEPRPNGGLATCLRRAV